MWSTAAWIWRAGGHAQEVARLFGRPFMGGLERLGIIAAGTPARAGPPRGAASEAESFILGADCTMPGGPTGITCGLRLQRRTTTADVRAQARRVNVTTPIWWVRRDLRLNDNEALRAAWPTAATSCPSSCWTPPCLQRRISARNAWPFCSAGCGRWMPTSRPRQPADRPARGAPAELARLVAETGAEALYAEADPWP